MPGGVIVGWVSDLYDGRRACVIATFMVILAPLLWVFAMYSDVMNPILLLGLLGLMGILVGELLPNSAYNRSACVYHACGPCYMNVTCACMRWTITLAHARPASAFYNSTSMLVSQWSVIGGSGVLRGAGSHHGDPLYMLGACRWS